MTNSRLRQELEDARAENRILESLAISRTKRCFTIKREAIAYRDELATVKAERDAALNERDSRPTWEHVESVKAELAAVKQERDRLDAATRRLSEESAAATCELAALRERERDSVPVKVRWSVTAKEADDFHLRLQDRSTETVEDTHDLMDYLAAHAVIDVPAGVPSMDPDACKTPLVIKGRGAHNSIFGFYAWEGGKGCKVTMSMRHPDYPDGDKKEMLCDIEPHEAKRIGDACYSFAAAHGCSVSLPAPEKPKGLPTRDELRAIMDKNMLSYPGWCTWQHIEAVVNYLATYLREPVGWELDVTAEGVREVLSANRFTHHNADLDVALNAVADWLRSRIRPVFECKECAKWKSRADQYFKDFCSLAEKYDALKLKYDAARAALEGE